MLRGGHAGDRFTGAGTMSGGSRPGSQPVLLAGDVGATKTVLALFTAENGLHAPLATTRFESGRYSGLASLVADFRARVSHPIDHAVFGVAGPVIDGRAALTNLGWDLEEHALTTALGMHSVRLINDLVATASAVPYLAARDVHVLRPGVPEAHGPIAVLAPGTGLGEAFLTWDGTRYRAHASEGGHADFAPRDDLQIELLRHLSARYGHVSYELACSGLGILNIYRFLRDTGWAAEPAWLAERLAAVADPVPMIVQAALDDTVSCKLCRATLEMFVAVLGAEAGNLALRMLATGGVYLAGGIPRRILPALEDPAFAQAFLDKGRLADLLAPFPLYVVTNPRAALLGAAHFGLDWQDDAATPVGGTPGAATRV